MVVRFGLFEFDRTTRELRREGKPVRLQAQPALVLDALLSQSGEVVSRDTLRQAVWGDATHGDFESGINVCIGQVRAALGDSAESPVYIRTVPKRGYQFLAPVESIAIATPPKVIRRTLLWLGFFTVSTLFFANLYRLFRPSLPLRIGVARFENQTGDPALDSFTDGLSDLVTTELARHPYITCIGNAPHLRRHRGFQDLDVIASALDVKYVVLGQVQGSAAEGRVLIHLIRMPDNGHLWVSRTDHLDLAQANRLQLQATLAAKAAEEFLSKLPI